MQEELQHICGWLRGCFLLN